jgi:hypothetical protein
MWSTGPVFVRDFALFVGCQQTESFAPAFCHLVLQTYDYRVTQGSAKPHLWQALSGSGKVLPGKPWHFLPVGTLVVFA